MKKNPVCNFFLLLVGYWFFLYFGVKKLYREIIFFTDVPQIEDVEHVSGRVIGGPFTQSQIFLLGGERLLKELWPPTVVDDDFLDMDLTDVEGFDLTKGSPIPGFHEKEDLLDEDGLIPEAEAELIPEDEDLDEAELIPEDEDEHELIPENEDFDEDEIIPEDEAEAELIPENEDLDEAELIPEDEDEDLELLNGLYPGEANLNKDSIAPTGDIDVAAFVSSHSDPNDSSIPEGTPVIRGKVLARGNEVRSSISINWTEL